MKVIVIVLVVFFVLDVKAEKVINYGAMVENNEGGTINITHKGNNYLEENLDSSVKKISKSYENYDIELEGKVNISKKFRPFRIVPDTNKENNPGGNMLKKTLNLNQPFYSINSTPL